MKEFSEDFCVRMQTEYQNLFFKQKIGGLRKVPK